MKTAKRIFSCLIMAATLVTFNHSMITSVDAAMVLCECGNPRCGGCERGRLLSAMRNGRANVHASNCACQTCTPAAAQNVYVESPMVNAQAFAEDYMVQQVGPSVLQDYGTTIGYDTSVVETACAPQCGCQRCRIKRRPRRAKCPQCDCDQCVLKVDKDEIKKSCFKVEQKEVCIPAVTLPWQKCPKTTSKMRVINVLKKHSYKCPTCKYTWAVNEPEPIDVAQPTAASTFEPQGEPAAVATSPQPNASSNELIGEVERVPAELPNLDNVPQPPLEATASGSGGF